MVIWPFLLFIASAIGLYLTRGKKNARLLVGAFSAISWTIYVIAVEQYGLIVLIILYWLLIFLEMIHFEQQESNQNVN